MHSPEKEKKTSTSFFQNGGFFPFPPGSNCSFSSLADSLSLGKPIMSSSGGKMSPPKIELTPTSKQPSTVVRPISQFGRHCCPGFSNPVPADDDSSWPGSGSILPWVFPCIQTCTSNHISERLDRRLQGWAVLIGATTTYAAARPLFFIMMRSNVSISSSVHPSRSFWEFSYLYSLSDIEITLFNALTSSHILAVVSSGVGGSRL